MRLFLMLFLFTGFVSNAQRKITATDSFKILGKVKKENTFTVTDLNKFPKVSIADQIIYNHKGEVKDTLTNLKGVLLKTVLAATEYLYEKPKTLNEFYLVCTASDGYKVVFSWNEIYNSEIGNHLYIITEKNGEPIKAIEERIILIATSDLQSGRRYIKALEKIEVRQAE